MRYDPPKFGNEWSYFNFAVSLLFSAILSISEKTDSIGKYFGLLSVLISSMIVVLFMKRLCFAPAGLG